MDHWGRSQSGRFLRCSHADEFGFSTYGLGAAAFGASVTPPPGTYITSVSGYYQGEINTPITFGNITLEAGAKVKFFQQALNGLYVPDRKVFGGNLGIGVTIPVGHNDLSATVTGPLGNSFHDETARWGLGDITTRVQLGWQDGDFVHLTYVQVVAPCGRYAVRFQPIIGLSRPGIGTGWAFTWTEKTSKSQFNGAVGVTFNFENVKRIIRAVPISISSGPLARDFSWTCRRCRRLRLSSVDGGFRQRRAARTS